MTLQEELRQLRQEHGLLKIEYEHTKRNFDQADKCASDREIEILALYRIRDELVTQLEATLNRTACYCESAIESVLTIYSDDRCDECKLAAKVLTKARAALADAEQEVSPDEAIWLDLNATSIMSAEIHEPVDFDSCECHHSVTEYFVCQHYGKMCDGVDPLIGSDSHICSCGHYIKCDCHAPTAIQPWNAATQYQAGDKALYNGEEVTIFRTNNLPTDSPTNTKGGNDAT